MAEKISSFIVERFLLGECSEDEKRRVEAAMAADPVFKRKIQSLGDFDAQFLKDHPAESMVPQIKARAAKPAKKMWWLYLTPALTLSLAAVFVTTWWDRPVKNDPANPITQYTYLSTTPLNVSPSTDGLRTKGGDALTVYFKAQGGKEVPLTNGETLPGGGALQVIFRTEKAAHCVLFSTDPKGELTWHFPAQFPDPIPKVEPATPLAVKDAFELDPATPWERFVLLTFERLPTAAELKIALAPFQKPGADLEPKANLPPGARATFFTVHQKTR